VSDTGETVVKLDPEYWERGTDPNRFPFLNILDGYASKGIQSGAPAGG